MNERKEELPVEVFILCTQTTKTQTQYSDENITIHTTQNTTHKRLDATQRIRAD